MTKGGVPVGHGSLVPGRSKDDEKGVAINPEAFITFKLTYQCHHCSKEWTKFETESVHLPGEYVEDARED